jgi:hypothetical protein
MTRVLVSIIAATLVAGGTAAADPGTPLRTIVYDVTSSRHCSPAEFGDEHGTLTIAIVAASADGGLIADVAFTGEAIDQPPMRVTVSPDGNLSYNTTPNPIARLCPEVAWVVPLLARGFLANREIAVGKAWDVSYSSPWSQGTTWYRVDRIDGARAVIAITAYRRLRGGPMFSGVTERSEGTMTYATDLLSPISLDLDSLFAHVSANLVHDSFEHH